MTEPSLEGIYARIDRAQAKFESLKDELNEFNRTDPAKIRFREHKTQERTIGAVVQSLPDVPISLRLLIGEIVHSLAAALDNLAFQLAFSYQLTLGVEDAFGVCDRAKTYFPIFATNTPEDMKTIKKRLRLISPEAASVIESIQPYNRRPDDPTSDPLWILRALDVIDKHRVVLAVAHHGKFERFSVQQPNGEPMVLTIEDAPWQPLEINRALFAITFMSDELPSFHPEAKFELDVTRRILFAETGLCDGHNALYILKEMIPHVRSAVVDPLAPFVGRPHRAAPQE